MAQRDMGRLEWTRRTQGRLAPRERVAVLTQAMEFQLRQLPWQALAPLGLRPRGQIGADVRRLRPPDTAAARAAEELCAEIEPHALVNHSHRTYLFGRLLGDDAGGGYDDEALYVAALLHDLGIAEAHRSRRDGCFTLVGAGAVEGVARDAGWSRTRAQVAAEAVTLHMNARLPDDSREARLLAAGAQLDALGTGSWRIDRGVIDDVLRRLPREGAKRELRAAFRTHARANPRTRAHFYHRYLLMGVMIRLAPFAE